MPQADRGVRFREERLIAEFFELPEAGPESESIRNWHVQLAKNDVASAACVGECVCHTSTPVVLPHGVCTYIRLAALANSTDIGSMILASGELEQVFRPTAPHATRTDREYRIEKAALPQASSLSKTKLATDINWLLPPKNKRQTYIPLVPCVFRNLPLLLHFRELPAFGSYIGSRFPRLLGFCSTSFCTRCKNRATSEKSRAFQTECLDIFSPAALLEPGFAERTRESRSWPVGDR